MKATCLLAACLLAAGMTAGCANDQNARIIVERNTGAGKIAESMAGTADQLVKTGKIDLQRTCRMADGVEIDVWAMKAKDPTGQKPLASPLGTVVVLHRQDESKASWPFFGTGQRLARMGYDVILPDLRAHGRSTGKYVTYGAKEKTDVKAIIDSLLADKQVHEPIYAMGVGLGAATAIQYAAIDARCKGVMAVTPFKDFRSFARRELVMQSESDFDKSLAKAGELAGFDPKEASCVEAAAKLTVPLLIVHGMIDLSVPAEQSQDIYQVAGGPKKLVLVTPGPEQFALYAVMEDWMADRMNMVATGGLNKEPASQPR